MKPIKVMAGLWLLITLFVMFAVVSGKLTWDGMAPGVNIGAHDLKIKIDATPQSDCGRTPMAAAPANGDTKASGNFMAESVVSLSECNEGMITDIEKVAYDRELNDSVVRRFPSPQQDAAYTVESSRGETYKSLFLPYMTWIEDVEGDTKDDTLFKYKHE